MQLPSQSSVGRARCAIVVWLIVLAGCAPIQAPTPVSAVPGQLIVRTEHGDVAGVVAGDVAAFKGIPYAAPPVGELRWRAPQPVAPWAGVRNASEFGPDCMQALSEAEAIQTTPSEDCLFVNVWQPTGTAPDAKLPVLVWIHGGGYVGGGPSISWYDGSAFARQGIVVVSLAYRLGRFGFFAHPALLAAHEGPVGNFGYMDQIAALQWVQTNIAAFSGDPQQVTLMGQSAGGASVLHLLTSPAVEGLFQRVVIMSGSGRRALVAHAITGGTPGSPSADQTDADFAASLGIEGDGPETLAALRALPADVLAGDLTLPVLLNRALAGSNVFPGTAMLDGTIVTGEPGDILRSGDAAAMPLIIGTTALDIPLHFPPSKLDPFAYFGEDAAAARAAYGADEIGDAEGFARLLLAIGADMTMHEPARFVARQMTAAGEPAWLYRFTYTAESTRPESTGQGHAGELPFLFDQLDAKYAEEVTDNDRAVARAFNLYVGNFVRTGDPNEEGLPAWPQFDPAQYELMNFTLDDGPVFGPEPRPGVALVERAADRE